MRKYFYENKNKDRQSLDSSVRWNDGGVTRMWLVATFLLLIDFILGKSDIFTFHVISNNFRRPFFSDTLDAVALGSSDRRCKQETRLVGTWSDNFFGARSCCGRLYLFWNLACFR